jgi:group II intron reverse transcriptase/maturase
MMAKSLFRPAPTLADLRAGPRGPLSPQRPEVLFSLDSLRRAWLKVKATGGGPGVDGVSIGKFETDLEANLQALQADVLGGSYRPQPVKRLLAPKRNGGLRPLALWALRDKVLQRLVVDSIEPYFESQFLPCSFGFRPGRSVADVVQAVVKQRDANRRWVADIDIKDCFDSLHPRLTMQFVRQRVRDRAVLGLIQAWLNAQVFNELHRPGAVAGAAQGAVISPLLANVYLHQVDVQLTKQGYQLIRYADDLLVCCRRKQQANQAMRAVRRALLAVRLQLNPHKSRIVHFDDGFKFLGVFFLKNEYFYL